MTTSRRMATAAGCAIALIVCGCASDETAPPPPLLDPVVSPTSLTTQSIRGSAEHGARVVVEGAAAAAEGVADPFVARFAIEVSLNENADNALSVFAIDAAGNRSAPAIASIVHEPPHPQAIALALEPEVVSADGGQMVATASIDTTEAISLEGFSIDFALAGIATGSESATTDASGRASVTFTGLTTAGAGSVTAHSTVGGKASEASASYEVVPGAAATVDLMVPATAEAGAAIDAVTEVADAQGNTIADAAIDLDTNAPGATVAGGELFIDAAGSWHVTATVTGSGLGDTETVVVTHETAPDAITVVLSQSPAPAGSTVEVFVLDSLGNTIADRSLTTLSSDAPAGATVIDDDVDTIAIDETGSYTVTAGVAGVSGDATLAIVAAQAAMMSATATPSPHTVDPSDPADPSSNSVVMSHAVEDAFGNPVAAPVGVSINMPAAFAVGTTLQSVTTAGSFVVISELLGGSLVAATPLVVLGPGPSGASAVDLELEATLIEAGALLSASFVARDPFGNLVSPQPLATVDSVPATGGLPVTGASPLALSFDKTGTFTVTASLAGGLSDGEQVHVVDTKPPTFDDVTTTLTGSVQGLVLNGVIRAGQTLTLGIADVADATGVVQAELVVQGAALSSQFAFLSPPAKGPTALSFSFDVPMGAPAGAKITVAAKIRDAAGNIAIVDRSGIIDPLSALVVEPGFEVRIVAIGFTNPRDVVLNDNDIQVPFGPPDRLYVADAGDNAVYEVDTTNPTFQGQANVTPLAFDLDRPEGLSLDEANNLLYVTTRSGDDNELPVIHQIDVTMGLQTPVGLVEAGIAGVPPTVDLMDLRYDPTDSAGITSGGTPILLAIDADSRGVFAFDLSLAPPLGPATGWAPLSVPQPAMGANVPWGIEIEDPGGFDPFLITQSTPEDIACPTITADDDALKLAAAAPSFLVQASSAAVVNARGLAARGSSGPSGATQVLASMGTPALDVADGFVIRLEQAGADFCVDQTVLVVVTGFVNPIGLALTSLPVAAPSQRDLFVADSATGIVYGVRGPF